MMYDGPDWTGYGYPTPAHDDSELVESIKRGIAEAAAGKTVRRDDFLEEEES